MAKKLASYKDNGLTCDMTSFKNDFVQVIAAAALNKFQPRDPIFDHFCQQLGLFVSNNARNILSQSMNRLELIEFT